MFSYVILQLSSQGPLRQVTLEHFQTRLEYLWALDFFLASQEYLTQLPRLIGLESHFMLSKQHYHSAIVLDSILSTKPKEC